MEESSSSSSGTVSCPVCNRSFEQDIIEEHVNKCLFLNTQSQSEQGGSKRTASHLASPFVQEKRQKLGSHGTNSTPAMKPSSSNTNVKDNTIKATNTADKSKDDKSPLAERMRPLNLDDLVGQKESFGPGSMLRSMLQQKKIPNMILWGPPGCGKTSLANVVANICKEQNNMRFVKLSATISGINDVKEVVKVAKNEAQFKRQTVLFMDEIHRFNKLQQDTFLPHVENGTITLIGATTENPSFSLNNALLSRCRVVIMEKLSVDNVLEILERALERSNQAFIVDSKGKLEKTLLSDLVPKYLIERASLRWLAEVCDGDARVALGALELALMARDPGPELHTAGPALLTLDDIKDGIKRSHMVYDRAGEEHYNTISALHKSIRASDDNAALYWVTRAMHGGEDPLFIARRLVRTACEDIGKALVLFNAALYWVTRAMHGGEDPLFIALRLVRIACEDIGLGDPNAIVEAVACLHGCQHIGMPECDVLLAQCAVRLARAPKSTEVYCAMKRCRRSLVENKGPLPSVPLHLRNAPTRLMKQIGYGRGYNTRQKEESGLSYMPEGMDDVDFFRESDD